MHLRADSLDDLLRATFEEILANGEKVVPSKGPNKELFGVLLELVKPRARISRSETKGRLYSALGELFWYLSGSDELEFIQHYLNRGYQSDDGKTVWGAYGPRFFSMRGINQLSQIAKNLREKPSSRQAVIQLFNAEDIAAPHADTPCTCTLQFMLRATGLDMFVSMRSNDAYKGLPHDIFAFTMIQELLARQLGVEIGRYKHAAGSLHIYDSDEGLVKTFLDEGWQSEIAMPPMPDGDQWRSVEKVIRAEKEIRERGETDVAALELDPYWADIVRALLVYSYTKGARTEERELAAEKVAKEMSSDYFRPYIRGRTKA